MISMDDKGKIILDINKIKEKIREIKLLILNQEKILDEINSDEMESI